MMRTASMVIYCVSICFLCTSSIVQNGRVWWTFGTWFPRGQISRWGERCLFVGFVGSLSNEPHALTVAAVPAYSR
ncbi:hypothetical protein V1509DRAFT_620589 [Lipomyces kononenkoae]